MSYCANSLLYWMAAIIIVGGLEAFMGKLKKRNMWFVQKLPEPFVAVNASHNVQLFVHEIVINDRVMITWECIGEQRFVINSLLWCAVLIYVVPVWMQHTHTHARVHSLTRTRIHSLTREHPHTRSGSQTVNKRRWNASYVQASTHTRARALALTMNHSQGASLERSAAWSEPLVTSTLMSHQSP